MKVFVSYSFGMSGRRNLKEYTDPMLTGALNRVAQPEERRTGGHLGERIIFEAERNRWRKVPNKTEVREFLDQVLKDRSNE